MNALSSDPAKTSIATLIQALASPTGDDSMLDPLSSEQWDIFSSYLYPLNLPAGQVLFAQGTQDRTLYLVESGSLSVHYQDEKERLRLAIVGPGAVVGEGAFFSHRPRSATVQVSADCKLWSLTALRFTELSNRQPGIALGLVMAVGAVMAKRLNNRRRRVAST